VGFLLTAYVSFTGLQVEGDKTVWGVGCCGVNGYPLLKTKLQEVWGRHPHRLPIQS